MCSDTWHSNFAVQAWQKVKTMGAANDNNALFLGILVAFLIIFLAVIVQLSQPLDMHDRFVGSHRAYNSVSSGDILTVSYNSMRGKAVKVFTGSMWTHTGLVLKVGGEKYVCEVAYYRNGPNGVVLKPLKDWFTWNESRVLGWRPYRGNSFPVKGILETIEKDVDRGVVPDLNTVNWLKTLVKRKHRDKRYDKRERYFCSEYITHLMQEHGVVRKDYYPSGYKPWELLYGDMPFNEDHEYGSYFMIGKK